MDLWSNEMAFIRLTLYLSASNLKNAEDQASGDYPLPDLEMGLGIMYLASLGKNQVSLLEVPIARFGFKAWHWITSPKNRSVTTLSFPCHHSVASLSPLCQFPIIKLSPDCCQVVVRLLLGCRQAVVR